MKKIIIIIASVYFINCQDKGLKAYKDGDYESAQKYYEDILIKKNDNKGAIFGLGTVLYKQNDKETAANLFQSLINSRDKKLASLASYNYANILKEEGKNSESLEFFKNAIKLDSKNEDAKINYELLKKMIEQQDQQQQDQQQQDQQQQDQQQQDQQQQDQQQQDQQQQDQQQQDQQQESELLNKNKIRDEKKIQAESILNALKDQERINQKRQIRTSKTKKLEKDW